MQPATKVVAVANMPAKDKVPLNVRIRRELRTAASERAARNGETFTDMVVRLLRAEVDRPEPVATDRHARYGAPEETT